MEGVCKIYEEHLNMSNECMEGVCKIYEEHLMCKNHYDRVQTCPHFKTTMTVISLEKSYKKQHK